MKRSVIWLLVLFCGCTTFAKDGLTVSSVPDRFLIARHTFIDVGPPNDFYEIISVRGTASGTTVERVTLTPAGDACIQSPTVEVAASSIPDPVSVVLEGRNPCAIPDKALRKELKRRKQGLVFSGAEISMHVQCGAKKRIIRADVLDRDMFTRLNFTNMWARRTSATVWWTPSTGLRSCTLKWRSIYPLGPRGAEEVPMTRQG